MWTRIKTVLFGFLAISFTANVVMAQDDVSPESHLIDKSWEVMDIAFKQEFKGLRKEFKQSTLVKFENDSVLLGLIHNITKLIDKHGLPSKEISTVSISKLLIPAWPEEGQDKVRELATTKMKFSRCEECLIIFQYRKLEGGWRLEDVTCNDKMIELQKKLNDLFMNAPSNE